MGSMLGWPKQGIKVAFGTEKRQIVTEVVSLAGRLVEFMLTIIDNNLY